MLLLTQKRAGGTSQRPIVQALRGTQDPFEKAVQGPLAMFLSTRKRYLDGNVQHIVYRPRQQTRNTFSNELVDRIECRTVLDPVGIRLKKRVLDSIFLRAHIQEKIHRWAVVIGFGVPQACAHITRAQLDVPDNGVARLAFIALDEHRRRWRYVEFYASLLAQHWYGWHALLHKDHNGMETVAKCCHLVE